MDIVDFMEFLALVASLIVAYVFLFVRDERSRRHGHYSVPDWNFRLKFWYAERIVSKIKAQQHAVHHHEKNYDDEAVKLLPNPKTAESQMMYGCDVNGNYLLLKFTRFQHRIAEIWITLRLADGTTFTLPEHPDTRVCNSTPNLFEAHGLRLENLIPYSKWRITFCGLLRQGVRTKFESSINEEELQFVKFTFLWTACSSPQHWPYDWSPKLMATALALEPWKDKNWRYMLGKSDVGGYDQFGVMTGQITLEKESKPDSPIELNLSGLRQRRWGPFYSSHMHRTVSLIASLKNGILLETGAWSSKDGITHSQFGNFRSTTGQLSAIDWTDFHLANFAEDPNNLPAASIITMEAGGKKYQMILHFRTASKIPLMGGNPFNWMGFNVPFECSINGVPGSGMALFWYPYQEHTEYRDFQRVKRMFYKHEIESTELVLDINDVAAQNPRLCAPRGSLLALLTQIMREKNHSPGRRERMLKALLSMPLGRNARSRSYSEALGAIPEDDDHEDDVDFKEYVQCPDFVQPQGCVVTVSGFLEAIKADQNLKSLVHALNVGKTSDVSDKLKRIANMFNGLRIPQQILISIETTLSKYLGASDETEYSINLLNGSTRFSTQISSLEDLAFSLGKAWSVYFDSFNERFWSNTFPIVAVQVIPRGNSLTFKRLVVNGDPRFYSLKDETRTVVVQRDYRYLEYKIKEGESPLKDSQTLDAVKLGVTLEKMMGCDLEIVFRVVDNAFHIIALDDITETQLSTFELEHEFDTMSMAADLNPTYDRHTPLTLSSVIVPMSQAQQLAFYDNHTNGLYVIGARIRKLKLNLPTAETIRGLLAIDGELALQHVIRNAIRLKYAEEKKAVKFVENVRQLTNAEIGSVKEMIQQVGDVLKHSSDLWNYYYNLLAIQRSWIYGVFKFFCGRSGEMKAEHYEDFTMILQYFNLKDLAVQKGLQIYRKKGQELLNVDVKDMTEEQRDEFVTAAVKANPEIDRPAPVELRSGDYQPQEWNQQLLKGLEAFQQINARHLNSTFTLRFPEEHNRIQYILSHLCTTSNGADKLVMKTLLFFLQRVTKKLLLAYELRTEYMCSLKQLFAQISGQLNGEELYFMTAREFAQFGRKYDVTLLDLAARRKEILTALISKKNKEAKGDGDVTLFPVVSGTCVGSGSVSGNALVMENPNVEEIIAKAEADGKTILITTRLSRHFVWLPCLRLFDGIVLEAGGYFDTDAAICRLVGVPCIIGAKNATKLFKTGDKVVLNGTKGQLMKQIVSTRIQEGL